LPLKAYPTQNENPAAVPRAVATGLLAASRESQAGPKDRHQNLNTFGFRTSVEGLSFVVGRVADVSDHRAPDASNCSAINTAYDPPMVRGITPHGLPSTSSANIGVWKHAQFCQEETALVCIRWSVRSPSKSRRQTSGTATEARLLFVRTASMRACGVN
jgi:hypothetical protein